MNFDFFFENFKFKIHLAAFTILKPTTTPPHLISAMSEPTKLRAAILDSVEEHSNVATFLKVWSNSKSKQSLVTETVVELSKANAKRFFVSAKSILDTVIETEAYVPQSCFSDSEAEAEENDNKNSPPNDTTAATGSSDSAYNPNDTTFATNSNSSSASNILEPEQIVVPDEQSSAALKFIKVLAALIEAYLEKNSKDMKTFSSDNLECKILAMAESLNELMFELQTCGAEGVAAQVAVGNMCERWWLKDIKNKDMLMTHLIPLLCIKSLENDATEKDLKRLYNLRDAMSLLDFADDSIQYLKGLLLRFPSSG